jgi:hypothetical protein
LSATAATAVTANIKPELYCGQSVRALSRALVVSALVLIVAAGFGFRVYGLDAEGLSEDELNKLRAVSDYRTKGLTSTNGEHPFLMKALMTASVVAAERWNGAGLAAGRPSLRASEETALRLPAALVGAFTSLLIYLVVSELFGTATGLIAAALWAFDPAGIGFNRIAKEDSFLLFFFLLANVFWLRGQRAAESGEARPEKYYWATAIAFGAMLASKYMPHLLSISAAYYYIFQGIPATRWRMGKRKWLLFFAVMGVAFLVCNPTILLPGTWREMRIFAGEQRIGHDAYEFMGQLYRNQMTLWFKGSPWYFYYAFMAFKLPLTVLAAFLVGLPLLLTKRLGDGRYFVFFWLFFWFFPFPLLGGKFTRYFTMALPVVLITAAIGISALGRWLAQVFQRRDDASSRAAFGGYAQASVALLFVAASAYASAGAMPHYRLYTNAPGGGHERAGSYFPHDEFYDASMRDAAERIAATARPAARVASEAPELLTHYVERAGGRTDLVSVSLSDRAALQNLQAGDIVVVARGRRYFSNDAIISKLGATSQPVATLSLAGVESTRIYQLDDEALNALSEVIGR